MLSADERELHDAETGRAGRTTTMFLPVPPAGNDTCMGLMDAERTSRSMAEPRPVHVPDPDVLLASLGICDHRFARVGEDDRLYLVVDLTGVHGGVCVCARAGTGSRKARVGQARDRRPVDKWAQAQGMGGGGSSARVAGRVDRKRPSLATPA